MLNAEKINYLCEQLPYLPVIKNTDLAFKFNPDATLPGQVEFYLTIGPYILTIIACHCCCDHPDEGFTNKDRFL